MAKDSRRLPHGERRAALEHLARLEERLAALDRRVDDGFDQRDKALELQAVETERRLEGLNHEASRINAANARSVNVDVYRAEREAVVERVRVMEKHLDRTGGSSLGRREVIAYLFATAGFAAALVAVTVALTP